MELAASIFSGIGLGFCIVMFAALIDKAWTAFRNRRLSHKAELESLNGVIKGLRRCNRLLEADIRDWQENELTLTQQLQKKSFLCNKLGAQNAKIKADLDKAVRNLKPWAERNAELFDKNQGLEEDLACAEVHIHKMSDRIHDLESRLLKAAPLICQEGYCGYRRTS
jgi:chromosome segregation ATPase